MRPFAQIVGAKHVLTTPADMAAYLQDWTGVWKGRARAVVRPGSTAEVSGVMRAASELGLSVTVQSGNTSLAGGSVPHPDQEDGIVLSMGRMNKVRHIDAAARTATVDAGVVIQVLQDQVADLGLDFPLMFAARGSACIGGALASNAGGANVVRYGNTRDLCLGIEAVLPSGEIVNNLTGLRKDNSGYDLKNLLIASEGTLGVITGAVLRLVPTPLVRATAFLGLRDLQAALEVLNVVQDASGGLVEAFEWMPRAMVGAILEHKSDLRAPLDPLPETGVLVELASTRPSDAQMDPDGSNTLHALLLGVVETLMERGLVTDGMFAASDTQRMGLWHMREAALETISAMGRFMTLDASLPLSSVPDFVAKADPVAAHWGFAPYCVAHLGDGNVHYAVVSARPDGWDTDLANGFSNDIMDLIGTFGGSFSAEHGIGRSKAAALVQRKDPAQLQAMRDIKHALDPNALLGDGVFFDD